MSEATVVHCPHCGAPINAADDKCAACGAELFAEPAAAESGGKDAAATAAGWPAAGADQASDEGAGPGKGPADAPAEGPAKAATEPPYLTVPGAAPVEWESLRHHRRGDRSLALGGVLRRMIFGGPSLSQSWVFYKATLRMMRDYPMMVAPMLFAVVMGGIVAAVGLTLAIVTGVLRAGGLANLRPDVVWLWALLVPLGLLCYAAIEAGSAMAVYMVDAYLCGRRASLGEALHDLLVNLPALCYLALVNLAVTAAEVMLRDRSFVGDILVGSAEEAQRVATGLIVPIVMMEDKSIGAATKRAYALFRPRALDVFIGDLNLLFLGWVFAIPALVVFGLVLWLVATYAAPLLVIAVPVVVGLVVLGGALLGFVRTVYYTSLYLWATAIEASGREAVPPPLPLGQALQQA